MCILIVNFNVDADLHRAMMMTAPGEKLLIGRRSVRNWTRVRYQACFCAENYMTVLSKINKNCCQQSYTFQYAQIGAYSAPPVPLAVFRGLPLGEGRGGEGGNSSYALERKKRKLGACDF